MATAKSDTLMTHEGSEYADLVENTAPRGHVSTQKATKQMLFFSLYIGLAGFIFNFDLGKTTSFKQRAI